MLPWCRHPAGTMCAAALGWLTGCTTSVSVENMVPGRWSDCDATYVEYGNEPTEQFG